MKRLFLISSILSLFVISSFAQNEGRIDNLQFDRQLNNTEIQHFAPIGQRSSFNNALFSIQREMPMAHSINFANQELLFNDIYGFTPYSFSFQNLMEGVIIKGFHSSHFINDFLSANINTFVSKMYFGNQLHSPDYINASLRLQLMLRLHDRVHLTGTGQVSVREGINPEVSSLMHGANSYGAGIQFRITNKVGIGAGFSNSFYRGNWSRRTHINPVGY
jgi:hypothetical protein